MTRVILHEEDNIQFPIALVVSRFNERVTGALLEGALQRLKERGFDDELITVVHVPGAVEIPVVLQRLAALDSFQALVALGAVVQGETGHYDWVCKQVSDGCQKVALDYQLPVIFGVLTTDTGEQAIARSGGAHSHKGIESIDAAIETVAVLRGIG